jgi:cytochrome P450
VIDENFCKNPYPSYDVLRASGPLHWSDEFCGGAWLLPNYADVLSVLRDPRFSTQRGSRWINSSAPEAKAELREFKRIFARSLMFLNGAHHARLRKVMNAGFKSASLQAMAPRIQLLVERLLEDISTGQEIDFMRDFARPLPALVIAEMLRIDSADQDRFVGWSDDIAEFIGSPTPTLEIARCAQRSLVALNEYFRDLLPQRRKDLGADLISQLIEAEQTGGVITTDELLAQCCTLLFAGHETTRNLLGNGLFNLLQHPVQLKALQEAPSLMSSALKELLRFDSPVQFTGRILTCDLEMHGRQLKKGDLVIPLIGAANRDPAKFSEPDRLDLRRSEANHLSFGYGAHVCIGAMLTYIEAEIAFTSLLPLLSRMELAGEAAWGSNPVYRSLASLPVRFQAL